VLPALGILRRGPLVLLLLLLLVCRVCFGCARAHCIAWARLAGHGAWQDS
jgi:hypothetical protein